MFKRKSYNIKLEILNLVKDTPYSYARLERELKTGYRTIKDNCKEMQHFGFLSLKEEVNRNNNKLSNVVFITLFGKKFLNKEMSQTAKH